MLARRRDRPLPPLPAPRPHPEIPAEAVMADTRTARREPGSHGGHSGMRHGGDAGGGITLPVPVFVTPGPPSSFGVFFYPPRAGAARRAPRPRAPPPPCRPADS